MCIEVGEERKQAVVDARQAPEVAAANGIAGQPERPQRAQLRAPPPVAWILLRAPTNPRTLGAIRILLTRRLVRSPPPVAASCTLLPLPALIPPAKLLLQRLEGREEVEPADGVGDACDVGGLVLHRDERLLGEPLLVLLEFGHEPEALDGAADILFIGIHTP